MWISGQRQRRTTKKYVKAKKKPRASRKESKEATLFLESHPRMVTRNGRKKRERGKRKKKRKESKKGRDERT